jgi:hypothetical protein
MVGDLVHHQNSFAGYTFLLRADATRIIDALDFSLYSDTTNVPEGALAGVINLTPVLPITINIKPEDDLNSLNLKAKGVVSVAVLTTEDFDATEIDPETVQFGPAAATKIHAQAHVEDVDYDGDLDLLLHFRTQETGIQCGDSDATLTGTTWDGTSVTGTDSVNTVCK